MSIIEQKDEEQFFVTATTRHEEDNASIFEQMTKKRKLKQYLNKLTEFGGGFEPKPLKLYDILCLELKPDSPKIRRAIENLNLDMRDLEVPPIDGLLSIKPPQGVTPDQLTFSVLKRIAKMKNMLIAERNKLKKNEMQKSNSDFSLFLKSTRQSVPWIESNYDHLKLKNKMNKLRENQSVETKHMDINLHKAVTEQLEVNHLDLDEINHKKFDKAVTNREKYFSIISKKCAEYHQDKIEYHKNKKKQMDFDDLEERWQKIQEYENRYLEIVKNADLQMKMLRKQQDLKREEYLERVQLMKLYHKQQLEEQLQYSQELLQQEILQEQRYQKYKKQVFQEKQIVFIKRDDNLQKQKDKLHQIQSEFMQKTWHTGFNNIIHVQKMRDQKYEKDQKLLKEKIEAHVNRLKMHASRIDDLYEKYQMTQKQIQEKIDRDSLKKKQEKNEQYELYLQNQRQLRDKVQTQLEKIKNNYKKNQQSLISQSLEKQEYIKKMQNDNAYFLKQSYKGHLQQSHKQLLYNENLAILPFSNSVNVEKKIIQNLNLNLSDFDKFFNKKTKPIKKETKQQLQN